MQTAWKIIKRFGDGCYILFFRVSIFQEYQSVDNTAFNITQAVANFTNVENNSFEFGWVINKKRQESQNEEATTDRQCLD